MNNHHLHELLLEQLVELFELWPIQTRASVIFTKNVVLWHAIPLVLCPSQTRLNLCRQGITSVHWQLTVGL
jgi:hypothetical protein